MKYLLLCLLLIGCASQPKIDKAYGQLAHYAGYDNFWSSCSDFCHIHDYSVAVTNMEGSICYCYHNDLEHLYHIGDPCK